MPVCRFIFLTKKVIAAVGAWALLALSQPARAGDLNAEVNDMFNNLGAIGNYTAPGAFRSQTFNTYTGGGLMMRSPNKVYQLAAIRCPSARAGCGGWYGPAQRCPSPNFGPRPAGIDISLIVLHSISLPPGVYGGRAVLDLFGNRLDWSAHPSFQTLRGSQVSAHFFIRRGGRIVQCVSGDDRAWHAGQSSWRGRENCNDYAIGIELEGLEGGTFAARQYAALTRLAVDLARRYPIAAIAGHQHIAPERKRDPGPGFDWARLKRRLTPQLDHPLEWP